MANCAAQRNLLDKRDFRSLAHRDQFPAPQCFGRYRGDCVAKLSLRRPMNRDSVE